MLIDYFIKQIYIITNVQTKHIKNDREVNIQQVVINSLGVSVFL